MDTLGFPPLIAAFLAVGCLLANDVVPHPGNIIFALAGVVPPLGIVVPPQ